AKPLIGVLPGRSETLNPLKGVGARRSQYRASRGGTLPVSRVPGVSRNVFFRPLCRNPRPPSVDQRVPHRAVEGLLDRRSWSASRPAAASPISLAWCGASGRRVRSAPPGVKVTVVEWVRRLAPGQDSGDRVAPRGDGVPESRVGGRAVVPRAVAGAGAAADRC